MKLLEYVYMAISRCTNIHVFRTTYILAVFLKCWHVKVFFLILGVSCFNFNTILPLANHYFTMHMDIAYTCTDIPAALVHNQLLCVLFVMCHT